MYTQSQAMLHLKGVFILVLQHCDCLQFLPILIFRIMQETVTFCGD